MQRNMRPLITILLSLVSSAVCSAFAPNTELTEQFAKADTVIRIVVVSETRIEGATTFTAIAKCRVITKIKGGESLGDFIFIPSTHKIDPDRSPIYLEGDYVVMLIDLKGVGIGHPVSFDSVYRVKQGKIELGFGDNAKSVLPEEFYAMIEAATKKK